VLLGLAIAAFAGVGAKADGVDSLDPTVITRRVDPPPIAITSPNQTFSLIATAAENLDRRHPAEIAVRGLVHTAIPPSPSSSSI
jgi:hypothetical protein